MEIKESRLNAFIELYKSEFGITLTKIEAYKKASLLVSFVALCVKPLANIDDAGIIKGSNESE